MFQLLIYMHRISSGSFLSAINVCSIGIFVMKLLPASQTAIPKRYIHVQSRHRVFE